MKKLLLTLLLLSACHGYVVHPGAANQYDSMTYDTLIGAKATIDTARVQITSGVLPASTKTAFNALVKTYDTAYPAYLAYHDAMAKGLPADQYLSALTKDIADLSKALTAFKGGK